MSTTTEDRHRPSPAPGEPPATQRSGSVNDYVTRVRGGDVGALPAIAGLIVLVLVFTILSGSTFTNAFNFANLILQGSAIAVFAMGLVFVLLLGEIDLSAGYTGGVSRRRPRHLDDRPRLALGAGSPRRPPDRRRDRPDHRPPGRAKLGIPSFVVTLAYFLALQGVLLIETGAGGTIAYRNNAILAIMNKNMPVWLGWVFAILVVVAYAGCRLRPPAVPGAGRAPTPPLVVWALKSLTMAVLLLAATAYLSKERSRNVSSPPSRASRSWCPSSAPCW